MSLVGTVLHLRGTKTPQPLEDECGNVLLWNGEIFGGIEVCLCKINKNVQQENSIFKNQPNCIYQCIYLKKMTNSQMCYM